MNGARRRLQVRLGEFALFRRRFESQEAQAAAQIAAQQYQQTVNKMVETGYERFGNEAFDDMSQRVIDSVGADAVGGLNSVLTGLDNPASVIEHFADNPDEARRLAGMSPTRAAAQLAKIESRLNPNLATGNMSTTRPGWHNRPSGGRSPDAVLSDNATSDREWEKAFRKKYPEGMRRRGAFA
jgi:hypothetical protein